MSEQPKKVKVLTRLRINEVSVVDRGAGEQCKILISKRADDDDLFNDEWHREQAAIAERMNDELRAELRAVDEARERFAANWDRHVNKSDADTVAKSAVRPKKHRQVEFDLADGTHLKFPNERALAE